ncbi:DUF6270 domain-containing protein [Bacillus marasmi]|uniref:DUF6270 domain-containing protein n=1 Tax=Bacillus marasmi TaxID=1926279 RepID=UPI0011CC1186|nr:DUF6270 domain-containing protein [Bacillus marasmi]
MFAKFNSIEFKEDLNQLILKGEFSTSNATDEKPTIVLQERISADDYFIPKRIFLDTEWYNNKFNVSISINEITSNFNESKIWDCYILLGNKAEKIKIKNMQEFQTRYYSIESTYYMVRAYVTKIDTFALQVKERELPISAVTGSFNEDTLNIKFSISDHFFENNHEKNNLVIKFKKRVQSDILYHEEVQEFPVIYSENGVFSSAIVLKKLINTNYSKSTWDTYITLSNNNNNLEIDYPFSIEQNLKFLGTQKEIYKYFNMKFYRNYKKALSLTVQQRKLPIKANFLENEGQLILEGEVNNLIVENFIIKKESTFEDGELSLDIKELPFNQFDANFFSSFLIQDFFSDLNIQNNDKYNIYLKTRSSEFDITINFPVYINEKEFNPENSITLNSHFQLEFTLSELNKLTLICKQKEHKAAPNTLKIAVCGSCFSRLAFSSNDFYNPSYKSKYQIVHTQFHSSIISLMSNPVPFPQNRFEGFNEREVSYIKSDYDKDFFEQLKKANPDLFIIDFYIDGSKDVLLFDENHIITVNYMLRRNLNYLCDLREDVKVLSHQNISEYLNLWKESVKKFAEKIVQIIPEERIVLQRVRKTEGYITSDGKIENFDFIRHIKRSNYLYEYMEDYFLKLLPNIQTLNVSNKKYYSLYNHPENCTPDHLEPEYYKEFISQLDNIGVKYLLKETSTNKVTN